MFYFKKLNIKPLLSAVILFIAMVQLPAQCTLQEDWDSVGDVVFEENGSAIISTSQGAGAVDITVLEDMLGITPGSLNTLVNSGSSPEEENNQFVEGSAIKQRIVVCDKTEVCFNYQLFTSEQDRFFDRYTDLAFVGLVQDGVMSIIDLLDPSIAASTAPGYEFESPKMTFCHTFSSVDTGYLAIGILDEDDGGGKTDIFIDGFEINNCCPIDDSLLPRDPCSCENIRNISLPDGRFLFNDTIKVVSSLPVELLITDLNLLDASGNPIPANTMFALNPITDEYELEIFTAAGIESNITLSNGPSNVEFTAGPCFQCEAVPTMGEWGLMSLGLLLMIFGVASIKQRAFNLGEELS